MRGGSTLASTVHSVLRFFSTSVWEEKLADQPRWKAIGHLAARIAYSTARGFSEHDLGSRAAGLTYYSILSVVPFLAFAFSLLKGFGAYGLFISTVVRPYVDHDLAGNPALVAAIDKVFAFVGSTNVSGLGAVGLVFLGYSAVSLLGSVESVLNEIWDVKHGRRLFRRVTDYITMLVTTPLLVLAAITLGTAARSSRFVSFLRDRIGLGAIIDFGLRFTSLAGACLGMTVVMLVMPNTRVRVTSGLLGGVVAGALWQLALALEVNLQLGVANYNALYSGFAALPVFLVWVYVSWMTVLVGAEIAASHQNEQRVRQRLRASQANEALREALGLALAVRIARAFLQRKPRPSTVDLASELEAPLPLVDEAADRLAEGGVLVRASAGGTRTFVPGRDPKDVTAWEVLTILRGASEDGASRDFGIRLQLDPNVADTLEGLARAASGSDANVTLDRLALTEPTHRDHKAPSQ